MRPPLGVKLVSMLTGFYGVTWIWAGLLRWNHPEPSPWAAFGPWIGLAIVLLAMGLWRLHALAWVLALGLYGLGLAWTTLSVAIGAPDRLAGVATGTLIICYLVVRSDRFLEERRAPPHKNGEEFTDT